MKTELKFEAQPPAHAGVVHICMYCGEDAGTGKLCPTCKTKKGREGTLEANQQILKEGKEKGYFLGKVLLPVA